MFEIVFATQNLNKLKEINEISHAFKINAIMPSEGFNPVESGKTFEENSLIKAVEATRVEKEGRKFFLSDDSGLVIDALNGAPGLMSARYAETSEKRIEKVLKNMEGKSSRSAKFVCAMTLCDENGEVLHKTLGECKGKISYEPKGDNGFGYDPIFIPEGYNVSIAELDENEKNLISHRGKALRDMLIWMKLTGKF